MISGFVSSQRPRFSAEILLISAVIMLSSAVNGYSADKPGVQQAIAKAQGFLLQGRLSGGSGSIAGLAYVKSGGDKHAPQLTPLIEEILRKAPPSQRYSPISNHNYEASVDLMLLEAIDAEAYKQPIQTIAEYLINSQQPNGAWFYDRQIEPDCGDTSITQYAIMGLWAASRNEIEIPTEVWEKAARWHIDRQRDGGGFVYHPFERKLYNDPEHHRVTDTMTTAATSSLLIIRRVLFEDVELTPEVRPPETQKRFGVLERFVDGTTGPKRAQPRHVVTLKPSSIDNCLKESVRWISTHFGEKNSNHDKWFAYHLYSLERVAALMDTIKFGNHDWYDEGADELLKRQLPDGSWSDHCGAQAATAMGLMFLSKATTTIVAPKKRTIRLGGGLQAGGRGLPDQLDAVTVNEGMVAARKLAGPVDTLLIELEKSSDAKVEDIQAAVVEAVQLDHPEDLIGQTARLYKLATDARVEVRRTALWALGRSGNIAAARLLIEGLSDPDLSVVREASLALCYLSRRPEGCGTPIDPLDDDLMGFTEESTEEQRKTALEAWKTQTRKGWHEWYLKNRPYDERDDRQTLKKNNR